MFGIDRVIVISDDLDDRLVYRYRCVVYSTDFSFVEALLIGRLAACVRPNLMHCILWYFWRTRQQTLEPLWVQIGTLGLVHLSITIQNKQTQVFHA